MLEPPELGPLLKNRRAALEWTIADLARESGVSRSMISQIERAEANPTFAILWTLTQALGIDLQELAQPVSAAVIEIALPGATPVMTSDDAKVVLRILSPVGLADIAEWYEVRLEAGGVLKSSPHPTGTTEHLTVLQGEVVVVSGAATETVTQQATARYRADVGHELRNDTTTTATALLVVLTRSVA